MSAKRFTRSQRFGQRSNRYCGRAAKVHRRVGDMNKTEARYADQLELRLLAGEILDYKYEPEKFRLADNTFYTPDFRVVLPDETVEYHEVKPRSGEGYFAMEDAKVKIKVAAEMHPFVFCVVWEKPGKNQGWNRLDF